MSEQERYDLMPPVSVLDHAQGLSDAAITLVEFGDYECSYCGLAYPIVKEIQLRLGTRLRFIFRNFPLTELHRHAREAAEAAEAAGDQGAFWEMHDMLFENQTMLGDGHLREYAEALGLDIKQFASEKQAHMSAKRVGLDVLSGLRSGVKSTPTFFISGLRHDDVFELPSLLKALERGAWKE